MGIHKRYLDIKERLLQINPNVTIINGFDEAIVGMTQNNQISHVAVYDLEKCISILIENGITIKDAMETLENMLNLDRLQNDPIFISL